VASLLMAQLMVWSAQCRILRSIQDCNILTTKFPGISNADQDWLAFLATNRDSIIAPALNCLGHVQHRRSDHGIDPNRDFSYARRDNRCFLSTTARLTRELMRIYAIQLVITFHGGMEAIGYEWGTFSHNSPKDRSPDDYANHALAEIFSTTAGHFKRVPDYKIGRMSSLVYPVEGGMEDWLYAAGWDKNNDRSSQCLGLASNNNNNNNSSEDIYTNSRALVFLVETSNSKSPSSNELGGTDNILDPGSTFNGHVVRNVRLGLVGIDLLQPYVCWQSFIKLTGIHIHKPIHTHPYSYYICYYFFRTF
jgi:hypothetical protein